MNELQRDLDSLVEKFAELLIGDTSPEALDKIRMWALYTHIQKAMPPLAAHWSQTHPEAKAAIRASIEEIREKNEQRKAAAGKPSPEADNR